ncbi:MAG: hypothetical protein IAE87_05305 [Rhodobacteraceae bacterium]|nr:hypothetical protein [Paracoccaceae bacterium]
MSNPESFIDEVTEEVRRDRLFGLYRKYGWIGLVVILGIVGGTAFVEWQSSRDRARAEGFGDALIDALDTGSPDDRRAALAAVPADGRQGQVLDLIAASDPAEDKAATLAALDRLIADPAATVEWRDLAVLRRATVAGSDQPLAERRAALEAIAVAGRPYRALAAEQLAYLLVEEGRTDEAIAALNALIQASDATAALRARTGQVVTALGGTPAEAATSGTEQGPSEG